MDYEQLIYFFVNRFDMYIVHCEFFMRKTHTIKSHTDSIIVEGDDHAWAMEIPRRISDDVFLSQYR